MRAGFLMRAGLRSPKKTLPVRVPLCLPVSWLPSFDALCDVAGNCTCTPGIPPQLSDTEHYNKDMQQQSRVRRRSSWTCTEHSQLLLMLASACVCTKCHAWWCVQGWTGRPNCML